MVVDRFLEDAKYGFFMHSNERIIGCTRVVSSDVIQVFMTKNAYKKVGCYSVRMTII